MLEESALHFFVVFVSRFNEGTNQKDFRKSRREMHLKGSKKILANMCYILFPYEVWENCVRRVEFSLYNQFLR